MEKQINKANEKARKRDKKDINRTERNPKKSTKQNKNKEGSWRDRASCITLEIPLCVKL
jgi:hypothetical protein